jgi:hypothetical protein
LFKTKKKYIRRIFKMKRFSILVLVFTLVALTLASCGLGGHEHTFSTDWSKDATNHWITCTDEMCADVKVATAAHKDVNNDKLCDVCGYDYTHTHTYQATDAWTSDATNHWHAATCGCSIAVKDSAAHADANGDGKCDVCAYDGMPSYTVTVTAPDGVTVAGTLYTKPNGDVTFTATVSDKYVLSASGATQVGEATAADGKLVYTYKVAAVAADAEVIIGAEQKVFAETIANGDGEFENVASWDNTYGSITVTVPAAGTYKIFADAESGVEFATYTEEPSWETEFYQVFEFVAEQAGEITLTTCVYSYDDAELLEYSYTIINDESADFAIKTLSGEGYVLPANMTLDVKFIAPAAGKYIISSDVEGILINDEYGCTSVLVEATEEGEELTFTVKVEDAENDVFDFAWDVAVEETPVAIADGEDVVVPVDGTKLVIFTAPVSGNYAFSGVNASTKFGYWSSEYARIWYYDDYYYLEANESIVLYVDVEAPEVEEGEEVPATVTETFTATYLGEFIDRVYFESDTNQVYYPNLVYAYEDEYVTVTYIVDSNGFFKFYSHDAYLGIPNAEADDGYDWMTEIPVAEYAYGDMITFVVRPNFDSDDDTYDRGLVGIYVQEVVYEIELELGDYGVYGAMDNVHTYELVLPNADMSDGSYILTWDNEDVTVLVDGYVPCVSGEAFEYSYHPYFGGTTLYATYSGEDEAYVTFTLVKVIKPELVFGANAIVLDAEKAYSGVEYKFSAPGTYVLSLADGETNAVILSANMYGFAPIEQFPYEFTVADGESATFVIMTANEEADTIDLVIDYKTAPDASLATTVNGSFKAMFYDMEMLNVTFTPAADGKTYGTLVIVDNNSGALTGNYKYAVNALGGFNVWTEENLPADNLFVLSFGLGGQMTIQPANFYQPMDLVSAAGSGDDEEEAGEIATAIVTVGAWSATLEGTGATYQMYFNADGTGYANDPDETGTKDFTWSADEQWGTISISWANYSGTLLRANWSYENEQIRFDGMAGIMYFEPFTNN